MRLSRRLRRRLLRCTPIRIARWAWRAYADFYSGIFDTARELQ